MFFLLLLGLLCIAYDITLMCLNPGTFMYDFSSFTHIWSALGAVLIFLAVYHKKTGHSFWSTFSRRIKILVSVLLLTGASIALVHLAFILTPQISPLSEPADYLIVLGGGISKDGVLPETVMRRIDTAADYLNAHEETVCVVTGGTLRWRPYAEAPEMKRQLELKGIPSHRILAEDQALDTIQNLQLSCKLLSETQNVHQSAVLESHIIILTSRFHLRRAERLAYRIGYKNVSGIATPCPLIFIPHNYVREICAWLKLNMRILLTGKPVPQEL